MRILLLLIGMVLGGSVMALWFSNNGVNTSNEGTIPQKKDSSQLEWQWPDSLDALVAAPANHELIFENEEMRVLKVTVVPGILDPIHTHKGKSIIWVTKTSPILYRVYQYDAAKNFKLIRTDTINIKQEELFKIAWENPEPPHSVENIGRDTFQLYRIEYKR